jgi:TonB family protein
VIRQHISGFRACYEKALTKDPQLSTRVAPRFTIGVDGRVASVSLSSSSGDPALDSCIESVVKRLVFPKPKGGVVVVTYPFVFAPGN